MKEIIILLLLFVCGFAQSHNHGHGHDHGHGHEHGHGHHDENLQDDVKFRYSKQANIQKEEDAGPDFPDIKDVHEHNHDDNHDHGDHAHSHGGHDHGEHDHNHGGHGHGEHDHSHDGHNHGGHDHSHGGHDHEEHDHSHGGHGHGEHDKPGFKYSKQANIPKEEVHSHEEHDHSHGEHDHSHGETKFKKQVIPPKEEAHSHGDHGDHGHSHGDHGHNKKDYYTPPTKAPVFWFEPLLATAIISAAPFLILFVVPLNSNSPENQPFLKILLAFASGGLLGDAFLHLIPHAISPHAHDGSDSHSHEHSHAHAHDGEGLEQSHDHTGDMIVGLWVLAGIIVFLVVEKLVRHIKGGHGHSHGPSKPAEPKKEEKKGGDDKKEEKKDKCKEAENEEKDVKVSAYLNLAADCTHNFTDGLAIGASFLVSRNVGLITTLTIFLHEIPHEIGDFAILVQSGCTKRKAMMLQLVTAVGAFAGCICGLLAEGMGAAAVSWILPFTAGGFIYIATVTVIPELLEESKLMQSFKEILALLVGVFLMVLIALTE